MEESPRGGDPLAWIDDALQSIASRDLRRALRTRSGPQAVQIEIDGETVTSFASNDYLGLAADHRLVEAAAGAAEEEGWGAGSSPLIVGHAASHRRLESRLADFEGTEAALVLTSGFAANMGAITALVGRGDAVFSDALNHASIVDGCRLSRAEVIVYPHADPDALRPMLASAASPGLRLIVTDSLFSMHGDLAPLVELADLAEEYDAMLMVDEAHATGVFGRRGTGLVEQAGVEDRVHVRVGTLSKALGCCGGFVSGSQRLIDWLVNRARPYIFSTASIPANSAAAIAALDIVHREGYRRRYVVQRASLLRRRLEALGFDTGPSASQIIPIFVGESSRALALSAELRRRGLLVPAIRPPTVPEGSACLRISLGFSHTVEMIDHLVESLAACG